MKSCSEIVWWAIVVYVLMGAGCTVLGMWLQDKITVLRELQRGDNKHGNRNG